MESDICDNFLIWLKEFYIFEVEKHGALKSPRLCRVLSHRDEGSSYTLQWEVENSTLLHRWHLQQGVSLSEELLEIFDSKVIGFPTLMEVIE